MSPARRGGRRAPTFRIGGQELEAGSGLLEEVLSAEHREFRERQQAISPLPPRGERSSMGELQWQNEVISVAKALGYYVYHPKLSRWSERGWPDLSLLHELRRRALWIECKSDRGELTEPQVRVITAMRACGLEVYVLRPHDGLQGVADLLGGAAHPRPLMAP